MRDGDGDRFDGYVEALQKALGHADREEPFRWYTTGLLWPLARKSVEPIAARIDPARVSAVHQSLHHFVAQAEWSDEVLLAGVLPKIAATGPITAWIVDDTGFPKKGRHSLGVTRQYCGQLGKQDNCQVAVSLSVANQAASLPIAYQLYLPQDWAEDPARRARAGVPRRPRLQDQADDRARSDRGGFGGRRRAGRAARRCRLRRRHEIPGRLARAGAGLCRRRATRGQGLGRWQGALASKAVVGSRPATEQPAAHARSSTRRGQGLGDRSAAGSLAGGDLARGVKGDLGGRFAAARVRPAHRDYWRNTPWPELWLLVEWPEGTPEPTKYWFANLPADTPLERLVELAKLRWRIERDYLELKQELGLGHYEWRGWRGFHHHAALCIAGYGFLVGERLATSPSTADTGSNRSRRQLAPLPAGFAPRRRPRTARAPRPLLDRHPAQPHRRPTRQAPATMSLLLAAHRHECLCQFMTQ